MVESKTGRPTKAAMVVVNGAVTALMELWVAGRYLQAAARLKTLAQGTIIQEAAPLLLAVEAGGSAVIMVCAGNPAQVALAI